MDQHSVLSTNLLVSQDVPGFLNWVKTLRTPDGGTVPVKDQTAGASVDTAPRPEEPNDTDTNVPLNTNATAAPLANPPPAA